MTEGTKAYWINWHKLDNKLTANINDMSCYHTQIKLLSECLNKNELKEHWTQEFQNILPNPTNVINGLGRKALVFQVIHHFINSYQQKMMESIISHHRRVNYLSGDTFRDQTFRSRTIVPVIVFNLLDAFVFC